MFRSALVSSLLTAVLVAGCGAEDASTATPDVKDVPGAAVEPSLPTTSPPAVPVHDGTGEAPSEDEASSGDGSGGGATGDRAPAGEEPAGEEPAGEEPAGEEPAGDVEPPTVWPAEVTPVHGGRVWAVYLAVGSPDSVWDMHMLGETESYLRGLGYAGSGIGSVGCDQGAAEALGFDPGDNRVAVYFDSAARAQEFVAVYDRQDVGSAQVTTYCLD